MKTHILSGKESQASVINYRKNGEPFINLVTIIPITWDTDEIAYFVGFQVDLVDQVRRLSLAHALAKLTSALTISRSPMQSSKR